MDGEEIGEDVTDVLKEIVEFELAGVVRFTHYALMVSGPNRIPIVDFLKAQAVESLGHAQRAGEILVGFGAHPNMRISAVDESHQHTMRDILEESYAHEKAAIAKYYELVQRVNGKSVFLEEYARGMVATEEEHLMEFRKMLRDLEV